MKYCKKCGTPNDNNAQFCIACGEKFTDHSAKELPETQSRNNGDFKETAKDIADKASQAKPVNIASFVFLGFFALFAFAAGGLSSKVSNISSSSSFEDLSSAMSEIYSSMRTIRGFYYLLFVIAVYMLVVSILRYRKKKKENVTKVNIGCSAFVILMFLLSHGMISAMGTVLKASSSGSSYGSLDTISSLGTLVSGASEFKDYIILAGIAVTAMFVCNLIMLLQRNGKVTVHKFFDTEK